MDDPRNRLLSSVSALPANGSNWGSLLSSFMVPAPQLPQRPAPPGLPYRTALSPQEEQAFQAWYQQNQKALPPWQDTPDSDYDMRGFYKAALAGDPRAKTVISPYDNKIHTSDAWKTPFHQTFSRESVYAGPDAPYWVGNKLYNRAGQLLKDETPR
jgi:hypothetical protein